MLDWNIPLWNISSMTKLKEFLKTTSIRQEDFADKVGSTQATVSKWASGFATPNINMALKIAHETGGQVPLESWAKGAA